MEKSRWLTPRELLVAQGFPIREAVLTPRDPPTTSFDVPVDARRRSQTIHRAGNAMHVNVIGLVFLYSLTQIKDHDSAAMRHHLMPMLARIIAEGD